MTALAGRCLARRDRARLVLDFIPEHKATRPRRRDRQGEPAVRDDVGLASGSAAAKGRGHDLRRSWAAADHRHASRRDHRSISPQWAADCRRDELLAPGTADQAHRRSPRKYHANYVLSCPDSSTTTIFEAETPKGFYAQLQHGQVPNWLSPVPLPKDSPFRMWKVNRKCGNQFDVIKTATFYDLGPLWEALGLQIKGNEQSTGAAGSFASVRRSRTALLVRRGLPPGSG